MQNSAGWLQADNTIYFAFYTEVLFLNFLSILSGDNFHAFGAKIWDCRSALICFSEEIGDKRWNVSNMNLEHDFIAMEYQRIYYAT